MARRTNFRALLAGSIIWSTTAVSTSSAVVDKTEKTGIVHSTSISAGNFLCARAFVPAMRRQKSGRISASHLRCS